MSHQSRSSRSSAAAGPRLVSEANSRAALDREFLKLAQDVPSAQFVRYGKGDVLHWQGDPVEAILVVQNGAIKVSSVSADGRTSTYSVLGSGSLIGAEPYLLGQSHETLAEAIEDTQVIALQTGEFQRVLATDPGFSLLVMKKLAQDAHSLSCKVRDWALLDVQQRIKSSLVELANDHGIVSGKGIRIDLDLTHEEIGEMVAANRTTITACLSELRRQGYLWKEGRHLYIIPPDQIEILDGLDRSVVDGSEDDAQQFALESIRKKVDPLKALEALTSGMRRVDRMFARDEIDVSDVILAAYAMKRAIPVIENEIERTDRAIQYLGTIVIGTVHGDIHDIGRTLVSMLLKARGFRVIDLGVNVPADRFVDAVRRHKPQILALSTLMSTTAQEPFNVIHALAQSGLRDQVKVIVGGNAITRKLSEEMGSDGYETSAHRAAELAWRLTRGQETSP
jgi:5-methyltetrahydrofolate--homocysteine methyltransferase